MVLGQHSAQLLQRRLVLCRTRLAVEYALAEALLKVAEPVGMRKIAVAVVFADDDSLDRLVGGRPACLLGSVEVDVDDRISAVVFAIPPVLGLINLSAVKKAVGGLVVHAGGLKKRLHHRHVERLAKAAGSAEKRHRIT